MRLLPLALQFDDVWCCVHDVLFGERRWWRRWQRIFLGTTSGCCLTSDRDSARADATIGRSRFLAAAVCCESNVATKHDRSASGAPDRARASEVEVEAVATSDANTASNAVTAKTTDIIDGSVDTSGCGEGASTADSPKASTRPDVSDIWETLLLDGAAAADGSANGRGSGSGNGRSLPLPMPLPLACLRFWPEIEFDDDFLGKSCSGAGKVIAGTETETVDNCGGGKVAVIDFVEGLWWMVAPDIERVTRCERRTERTTLVLV